MSLRAGQPAARALDAVAGTDRDRLGVPSAQHGTVDVDREVRPGVIDNPQLANAARDSVAEGGTPAHDEEPVDIRGGVAGSVGDEERSRAAVGLPEIDGDVLDGERGPVDSLDAVRVRIAGTTRR